MARSRRRPVRRRKGTRSRTTARLAPKSRFPTAAIVIGAGAAGVAALLLWRSSSEAAATSSSTQTTGALPSGVNATVPRSSGSRGTSTFNLNGPAIPSAVAQRINSSETARQVFAIQALIYEFGTSNQAPDGLTSTLNSQLADLSAVSAGAVGPTFTGSTLAQVRQYLFGQDPGRTLRSLPWVMAQAQIDAVNLSAAQMDSRFIYLQALPAQITSAGMPLAPAG